MIDLGMLAVMAEAVEVGHVATVGSYNAAGKWVTSNSVPASILATVHPADGSQLMNLPEGIRSEARYLMWAVVDVAQGDIVVFNGSRYKVIYKWPRPEGGFTRAALGLMTNE